MDVEGRREKGEKMSGSSGGEKEITDWLVHK